MAFNNNDYFTMYRNKSTVAHSYLQIHEEHGMELVASIMMPQDVAIEDPNCEFTVIIAKLVQAGMDPRRLTMAVSLSVESATDDRIANAIDVPQDYVGDLLRGLQWEK